MARAETPDQFAASLMSAATKAPTQAKAAVKKAAQNIKTESQKNVQQSAPVHNGGAWRAINYDEPTATGHRVETEVGYDRTIPAGRLGNLLEFGGGGDRSPAHRDLGRAADAEESRFEDALKTMAVKLL